MPAAVTPNPKLTPLWISNTTKSKNIEKNVNFKVEVNVGPYVFNGIELGVSLILYVVHSVLFLARGYMRLSPASRERFLFS